MCIYIVRIGVDWFFSGIDVEFKMTEESADDTNLAYQSSNIVQQEFPPF